MGVPGVQKMNGLLRIAVRTRERRFYGKGPAETQGFLFAVVECRDMDDMRDLPVSFSLL